LSKQDIELGMEISYNAYSMNLVSTVIALDTNTFLIGWKEKPLKSISGIQIGWGRDSCDFDCIKRSPNRKKLIHNFYEYNYFWWVGYNDGNYAIVSAVIISPNQVCIGCNLPSPHVKPNIKDKFACVACRFLADLDGVALGG
jgi:hypothetical protein